MAAGIPALTNNRERLLKEADAVTAGHWIIITHDYFSFNLPSGLAALSAGWRPHWHRYDGMSTVFSSTWTYVMQQPFFQQERFVDSRSWRQVQGLRSK